MPVIHFATTNKGKLQWLERVFAMEGLDREWTVKSSPLALIEIQSADIHEISLYKARQAFEKLQQPVLTMDGGFYIKELNGFPGPFGKYMFEQMGVENIAKLVGTLEDRHCGFRNVVTYMDGPESYRQFQDSTEDLFELTDKPWPHDHPQQWSVMWRLLVPTAMGYDKPLAAFSEEELKIYAADRLKMDAANSALTNFARSLKIQGSQEKMRA